jgi:hypothetical protein
MATFSKLQASIKLLHGDRGATLVTLTEGFREDFGHFARANNREALNQAIGELKKSPKDRAIADAISEGNRSAGLVEGYIGARTGKFASQPEDVQAKFNDALDRAVEAFQGSLEASDAFADKAAKTDAEKAKAKADKEAKAQANKEALITAMVQSGEIVRAVDIKTLADMSDGALILELIDRENSLDEEGTHVVKLGGLAMFDDVSRAYETLKAEYETLKAEYETLKTSKKVKAKATVPA